MYLRLAHYVYRLRLNRSGLHAKEDPAKLTKGMLQHWIKQEVVAPCARTAVEFASFLSPLVDMERIDSLLKKQAVNAKMFLSLNKSDRKFVMDHLKAGDLRCQLVALNLLLDAEEPIPSDFLQGLLSKLMRASAETDEEKTTLHNIAHAILSHLLQQDFVELSPQATAWLCHLYGKGENILLSLTGLYRDFPVVVYRKIVVLARHLLARTLDYMHETPTNFFDTGTPDGVFYNPSLMRNEVFGEKGQFVRVSVGYNFVDSLDLKKMVLVGNAEEIHSFMTSLASADMQPGNRDSLLVSLHYQLLFELVKRTSEDRFSEQDGKDGLRDRVLTVCLDSVANINSFRDSSEVSGLDRFDTRAQHNLFPVMRSVGRNISFFLFKALLEARSVGIKTHCYYFLRVLEQYTQLINADSLAAVFYDCQKTVTNFQQETGAVSLLLGWLAELVSCKNEQTDRVAFDLLIGGVTKEEFTS